MKEFIGQIRGRTAGWLILAGLWWLGAGQTGWSQTQTNGLKALLPAAEYNALVDLYNSTGGASWRNSTGWLDPNTNGWYGLVVGNDLSGKDHVYEINLPANSLNGTIPSSIGNLSQLVYLNLSTNQLSGSIPGSIGNLSQLAGLGLNNNQLSGSIPDSLGDLHNLQALLLSLNQLSGTIPSSLGEGDIPEMGDLELSGNQLTGSIPESLGNLYDLDVLLLDDNQLSGTIPDSLSNFPSIGIFSVAHNQLTGSIPPNLGDLSGVEIFSLAYNQLTGNIPENLVYPLNHRLSVLDLSNNQLSGGIPTNLVYDTAFVLNTVDLSNNQLTGDAPNFNQLEHVAFYFSSNHLDVVAGSQSLSNIMATIMSDNTVEYLPQILLGGPFINWPAPAAVQYGTPLGAAQLDASANMPGTFVYSPTNGAVLPFGTNQLGVVFTPADTDDYSSASASVSLIVTNPPAPALQISLDAGTVSISWSSTAAGFVLETSGSLPPSSWAAVAGNFTTNQGSTALSTNLNAPAAFYRLHLP